MTIHRRREYDMTMLLLVLKMEKGAMGQGVQEMQVSKLEQAKRLVLL